MWTYKNILFSTAILISGFVLIGCKPEKPVDRNAVKQEMESRELKRVSQADLLAKGEEIGKNVLEVTQKTFQTALTTAVSEEGISGAITYCNTNAMDIIRKLEDSLNISIKRVTDQPRNPKDSLTGIEKEIWEAYAYSPQNASTQILELDDKALIMTSPIIISSGLCLNCHGAVGNQITDENHSLIKELYPDDQATGYKVGDLRGMWSVVIPKKEVVRKL
ncbi:MAG: DUF3365 domain-containing protein [Marinoscillum sp.]